MDARGGPWSGRRDQNLPMEKLSDLARTEIRRVTRGRRERRRLPMLSARSGFLRWCILKRDIKDGHDVTPVVVKEFRVMLRRAGVKRRVWELHRDATECVLAVITANRGVWHPDRGDYLLYIPTNGEIWEHPERGFGSCGMI